MINTVNTIQNSVLVESLRINGELPIDIQPGTLNSIAPTLNSVLDINPLMGLTPLSAGGNELPKTNYLVIGIGGHTVSTTNGTNNLTSIQHDPQDYSLFSQVPFLMRDITTDIANDINGVEKDRYRLRKEISFTVLDVINNINVVKVYAAYYCMVGTPTAISSELNGVPLPDFSTLSTHIAPTPNLLPNPVSNNIYSVGNTIDFNLSSTDITEILNSINILNADIARTVPLPTVISELGLCSGVDRVMNTTHFNTGGPANPLNIVIPATSTEAISLQIVTHMSTMYPIEFMTGPLNIQFDTSTKIVSNV